MRECENSKTHISSNFLLSICLLIMLDTLLLGPSLSCNTSLHLSTLHYPLIWLNPFTFPTVLFHFTSLVDTVNQENLLFFCSVDVRISKYLMITGSKPQAKSTTHHTVSKLHVNMDACLEASLIIGS